MKLERVSRGASIAVRYGDSTKSVQLPDGGWVVRSAIADRARIDLSRKTLDRLMAPVSRLVRPGMKVCVVVTDVTRACPEKALLPPLLARLRAAGEVTVLVALGLHRPMTSDEKRAKYGRVPVVDHDPKATADFGMVDGVPMRVSPHVANADLVIATGIIEPHQYAGFSGGWKTVVIGCAGDETISATHGLRFLDDPRVAPGRLRGNPFQAIVAEVGRRTNLRFVINVAGNRVLAGKPDEVLQRGARQLRQELQLPHRQPFDVVIAGVGVPKDSNLYQASRALTYAVCGTRNLLAPGGTFILVARAPEGAGRGAGEQRFYELFRRCQTPQAVLATLRRDGVRGGEQRAVLLARALERARVFALDTAMPDEARTLGMLPIADATPHLRGRVLVVPDGMRLLV
jgi:lactate racemase